MSQKPAFLSTSRINEAPPRDTRNIRCQSLVQFAKGAPWRLTHLHDLRRDMLIWITRGQGRVIVNGVRRGIGTHNALYLPAGTLFAIDLGPQGFAQAVECPADLPGRLPKSTLHLRVRDSLAQAELTAEMEAMQREISRERPLMQDALEAHVGLIAVWIARQQATGSSDAPRDTAAQRLVKQFSRLVVRDFRTDLPMADYATALDVTPTHLTRVCRDCCGKTAAEILTERRLYEARILLAAPDPAIQDVARDLGFHSPAYFTRFIQTHTGQTPSALRKLSLGTAAHGRSARLSQAGRCLSMRPAGRKFLPTPRAMSFPIKRAVGFRPEVPKPAVDLRVNLVPNGVRPEKQKRRPSIGG